MAFDKTGTLTRGEPAVAGVVPLNGHSEEELLERATALEARSTHPLAKVIVEHSVTRAIQIVRADDVLQGKGVIGRFRGETYWLGSHRYLVERRQEAGVAADKAAALDGRTVVVSGSERHICGLIAVVDTVRPEAARVVTDLRARGIERPIMLAGDNRATTEAIARKVR